MYYYINYIGFICIASIILLPNLTQSLREDITFKTYPSWTDIF